MATADLDNDGYREILVTTGWDEPNMLLYNNGDGTFTDVTASAGLIGDTAYSTSATFGDFNLDGWLDIYVSNWVDSIGVLHDSLWTVVGYSHRGFANFLYINNGDGTFSEVAQATGAGDMGCGLATSATDYDNDGDIDLYNANDFGEWVIPNVLLRNDGTTFTDVSAPSGADIAMYGMGIAVGDYDHDLDLDYYVTNIGANALFEQSKRRQFSRSSTIVRRTG